MAVYFPTSVYLLCFLTSAGCAALLMRSYRRTRTRLLLWSACCFVGLTVNNVILFFDLVIYPAMDLRPARLIAALAGKMFLLYAFIFESE